MMSENFPLKPTVNFAGNMADMLSAIAQENGVIDSIAAADMELDLEKDPLIRAAIREKLIKIQIANSWNETYRIKLTKAGWARLGIEQTTWLERALTWLLKPLTFGSE